LVLGLILVLLGFGVIARGLVAPVESVTTPMRLDVRGWMRLANVFLGGAVLFQGMWLGCDICANRARRCAPAAAVRPPCRQGREAPPNLGGGTLSPHRRTRSERGPRPLGSSTVLGRGHIFLLQEV